MARLPRIVVPGLPHHVTQRGTRRMRVFLEPSDYHLYMGILARRARRSALAIWTYCLMPNHVHLIAVPSTPTGLARPIGESHRRYALEINMRQGWTGHLWQERFASFPMDERHLLAAVRYVLLNPVRAGLAESPEEWPYSNARALLTGRTDPLASGQPLSHWIEDWDSYLGRHDLAEETAAIRRQSRSGRPWGSESFVQRLEKQLSRRLQPRPRGRPRARE